MLRTILVPLDGSTFARHALPAARSIALRTGATVTLALVHAPEAAHLSAESVRGSHSMDASTEAEQRRLEMNSLTARCCELVAVDVDAGCNLLDGPTVPALIEHAQSLPADLIVMTTHGRGAFSRAWLGSVVDGIVRHCPVPTLLVRPRQAAERMPPSIDQAWDVRRVLVPLDGSELAEQILDPATALAGTFGAELLLLRVVVPLPTADTVEPQSASMPPTYAAEQSYIDAIAQKLRAQGLVVRVRVEPAQQVARTILDLAKQECCDVIALATHGRGGLARLVIGSVADKIVRGAELPVLLLRP